MNFRGGYNVLLEGRPESTVQETPEPDVLLLPLQSRRFSFDRICVEDGRLVDAGDVIARDSNNFGLPLLAPRGGTFRLKKAANHVVLTDIRPIEKKVHPAEQMQLPHIVQEMGAAGIKRYKLLSLGAWQYFYDAYTGKLPDPLGTPSAVIVSTLHLEPFLTRGDVQLYDRFAEFTRGLEHLQSLLEYQPIYLIMPDINSHFASQVREHIRGYAWVKLVQIPAKYPYDDFNILARALGLKKSAGPIWSVRTGGVLAVDRALTLSMPCLVRIIAVGGPAVKNPIHLKTITGYPVKAIIDKFAPGTDAQHALRRLRVIRGGIFTGESMDSAALGLDTECRGLTILPEHTEREFLGFMRPGYDRSSYSGCFLSLLRRDFPQRLTTAVRGELRPCISCNFCEEVCPAGITPHLIHKHLYRDSLEDASAARVDLCVECGLCSFVCPSKIELTHQFVEAKRRIEMEKEEIRREQAAKEKGK